MISRKVSYPLHWWLNNQIGFIIKHFVLTLKEFVLTLKFK